MAARYTTSTSTSTSTSRYQCIPQLLGVSGSQPRCQIYDEITGDSKAGTLYHDEQECWSKCKSKHLPSSLLSVTSPYLDLPALASLRLTSRPFREEKYTQQALQEAKQCLNDYSKMSMDEIEVAVEAKKCIKYADEINKIILKRGSKKRDPMASIPGFYPDKTDIDFDSGRIFFWMIDNKWPINDAIKNELVVLYSRPRQLAYFIKHDFILPGTLTDETKAKLILMHRGDPEIILMMLDAGIINGRDLDYKPTFTENIKTGSRTFMVDNPFVEQSSQSRANSTKNRIYNDIIDYLLYNNALSVPNVNLFGWRFYEPDEDDEDYTDHNDYATINENTFYIANLPKVFNRLITNADDAEFFFSSFLKTVAQNRPSLFYYLLPIFSRYLKQERLDSVYLNPRTRMPGVVKNTIENLLISGHPLSSFLTDKDKIAYLEAVYKLPLNATDLEKFRQVVRHINPSVQAEFKNYSSLGQRDKIINLLTMGFTTDALSSEDKKYILGYLTHPKIRLSRSAILNLLANIVDKENYTTMIKDFFVLLNHYYKKYEQVGSRELLDAALQVFYEYAKAIGVPKVVISEPLLLELQKSYSPPRDYEKFYQLLLKGSKRA